MKIDVLLQPCAIATFAQSESAGALCVVFDVLRATSSMLAGLACGVSEFYPVATIEAALQMRAQRPTALLGGERGGERIEGFDLGNSPFEYQDQSGKSIITTTTNGTVALRACSGASQVLIGAVVNLAALARAVEALQPERLVLVCAGTGSGLALEDVWAAGALVAHFAGASWNDAARTAFAVYGAWSDAREALRESENGRALLRNGREADVEWCALRDRLETVGCMEAGVVRKWSGDKLCA